MVGNAATQLVSWGVGFTDHFSWKSVAAAGVSAAFAGPVNQAIGGGAGASPFQQFAGRWASGIVSGGIKNVMTNGRSTLAMIAADAFGNELGGLVVERQAMQEQLAAKEREEAARQRAEWVKGQPARDAAALESFRQGMGGAPGLATLPGEAESSRALAEKDAIDAAAEAAALADRQARTAKAVEDAKNSVWWKGRPTSPPPPPPSSSPEVRTGAREAQRLERWKRDALAETAELPADRARTPWRAPVRADVESGASTAERQRDARRPLERAEPAGGHRLRVGDLHQFSDPHRNRRGSLHRRGYPGDHHRRQRRLSGSCALPLGEPVPPPAQPLARQPALARNDVRAALPLIR